MSVVIISKSLRSAMSMQNALKLENLSCTAMSMDKEEKLINFLYSLEAIPEAIILDRLNWELDLIAEFFNKTEIFITTDKIDNVRFSENIFEEILIRVYFSPINLHMLADDIKAVTKLKNRLATGLLIFDCFQVNLNRRTISDGKKEVALRNKEFDLLAYLARNKGKVVSRINILEEVWDMNASVMTNTVDVHVSRIRNIFKKEFGVNPPIRTIPCSGYIIN